MTPAVRVDLKSRAQPPEGGSSGFAAAGDLTPANRARLAATPGGKLDKSGLICCSGSFAGSGGGAVGPLGQPPLAGSAVSVLGNAPFPLFGTPVGATNGTPGGMARARASASGRTIFGGCETRIADDCCGGAACCSAGPGALVLTLPGFGTETDGTIFGIAIAGIVFSALTGAKVAAFFTSASNA